MLGFIASGAECQAFASLHIIRYEGNPGTGPYIQDSFTKGKEASKIYTSILALPFCLALSQRNRQSSQ
jgi:hypothetical protein